MMVRVTVVPTAGSIGRHSPFAGMETFMMIMTMTILIVMMIQNLYQNQNQTPCWAISPHLASPPPLASYTASLSSYPSLPILSPSLRIPRFLGP